MGANTVISKNGDEDPKATYLRRAEPRPVNVFAESFPRRILKRSYAVEYVIRTMRQHWIRSGVHVHTKTRSISSLTRVTCSQPYWDLSLANSFSCSSIFDKSAVLSSSASYILCSTVTESGGYSQRDCSAMSTYDPR